MFTNDVPFVESVSKNVHCGTIGAVNNLKCAFFCEKNYIVKLHKFYCLASIIFDALKQVYPISHTNITKS